VDREQHQPRFTKEQIRAAPISPFVLCCLCSTDVLEAEAIILTASRPGTPTRQNLWAHRACLEDAIRPAGIELFVE